MTQPDTRPTPDEAYTAAAAAYGDVVNAQLRNPSGSELDEGGPRPWLAPQAFRAAVDAVWALALAELQAGLDAARRQARINEGNLQRAQATLDNIQRNLAEDLGMQGAGLVTLIEESRRRAAERTTTDGLRSTCPDCGPGYRYGADGCRHTPPNPAAELDRLRTAVRHIVHMTHHGTALAPLLAAVVGLEQHLPERET